VLESPLPLPPKELDDDDQSLIYSTFLATLLLPTGPSYKEMKFSGNTEVGDNSRAIGHAVDTYAHHTVVDSLGTVLFADLQGMHQ
jgi:myosin-heavy-chain kinase